MSIVKEPLNVSVVDEGEDALNECRRAQHLPQTLANQHAAVTGRFVGFDLEDQPLIGGLPELPGEIVPARTTVALKREQIGATVAMLFDRGNPRRPIICGVLQEHRAISPADGALRQGSVQIDDDRLVLSAERELVLRCGAATITLTRAGKVLIKGAYILSRSSGYNRIKGAAVDIN